MNMLNYSYSSLLPSFANYYLFSQHPLFLSLPSPSEPSFYFPELISMTPCKTPHPEDAVLTRDCPSPLPNKAEEYSSAQDEDSSKSVVLDLDQTDLRKYIGSINRKVWTEEEDERLRREVQDKYEDWKAIALSFPERNANQCYGRYRRLLRQSKRKGWTKKEDAILLDCVEKYGQNWKIFSRFLENRTSKQIRQRYLNNLRPNITSEEWTIQEDLKICELVNENGRKWKMFEAHLPGRTENRIKNRFYGHIKKIHMMKAKEIQSKVSSESERPAKCEI